jgi:SAM-dependent methyltransferase
MPRLSFRRKREAMFTYIWRRFLAERVTRAVLARSAAVQAQQAAEARPDAPLRYHFFVPVHGIAPPINGPYMAYSTCSAADMRHPQFLEFCAALHLPPAFHRKLWEWAFVTYHLQRLGAVGSGKRGLVFGVGAETLPEYFASLGADIVATDAPPDIGVSAGWQSTNQFVGSADRLWRGSHIDRATFLSRVSYETCDMTNIPSHLAGFDFCWSSCCFEHLGSLEAGADFVVNSVENTLRPGGVAVHTTEFNLTSNDETLTDGPTVIYRKRDMEELINRLRQRGHDVSDLKIAPHTDPLDFHVDIPPNAPGAPHLKLRMSKYNVTSVGLAIRRGPAKAP